MIETNEWVCKFTYLQAITQAEQADIRATLVHIDRIENAGGPELHAILQDLDDLIQCY